MSGPIDGPRRPRPVSEVAHVTPAHEETERERDEKRESGERPPAPPNAEHDAAKEPPAVRPPEPGKGEHVDYRA